MMPLDSWLEMVAQSALSSKETLRATYDIARLIIDQDVPGDFVECGVYAGAQCAAMARAVVYTQQRRAAEERPDNPLPALLPRRVHLFDTFTGIPKAGEHDTEFLDARHETGLSACSLEAVQANMEAWGIPKELLVFHPGRVEDTLPVAPSFQVALLRLDCDLYEPTAACLKALYPVLAPGGWLIVDDFGTLSGARKAVNEFAGLYKPYMPAYFQRQP